LSFETYPAASRFAFSMRFRFLWFLLALPAACGSGPSAERIQALGSGVLVIEIDGWRRDHLATYGYGQSTMPYLEKWAQECLVLEDAWSSGSSVLPATVALLTGCDPSLSRHPGIALDNGTLLPLAFPWELPKDMPLLAFQFLMAGWNTALFDSTGKTNEIKRIHVGFERLGQKAVPGSQGGPGLSAPDLEAQWMDWLRGLDHGSDWYAHWHVADLEAFTRDTPFEPSESPAAPWDYLPPIAAGEPAFQALPPSRVAPGLESMQDYVAAYDAALLRLDQDLQALLESLRSRNLLGRTTVVLVGGYGMGFGESGLFADAGTLSEVDLAVPLLVRPAAELGIPTGRRIAGLASLVDVAPTVLELARLPVPTGWQGRSLGPLWRGESAIRSEAFAIPAIHEGFAVIDQQGLFLHMWPQRGGSPLLEASWFGKVGGHEEPFEVLLARGQGLRPLAYRHGVKDSERSGTIRSEGLAWQRWTGGLAAYLHSDPFGRRRGVWVDDPSADPPFQAIPDWVR